MLGLATTIESSGQAKITQVIIDSWKSKHKENVAYPKYSEQEAGKCERLNYHARIFYYLNKMLCNLAETMNHADIYYL